MKFAQNNTKRDVRVALVKVNGRALHRVGDKEARAVECAADVGTGNVPVGALRPVAGVHDLFGAAANRPDGSAEVVAGWVGREDEGLAVGGDDGVLLHVGEGGDAVKRKVNVVEGDGVDVAGGFLHGERVIHVELAHALHWTGGEHL